jgi:hypothetical protein
MATFIGGFVKPGVYVKERFLSQGTTLPGYFTPVVIGVTDKTDAGIYDVKQIDSTNLGNTNDTSSAKYIYGAYSFDTNDVVYGSKVKNSISLAEEVFAANGIKNYYALALNPKDETTGDPLDLTTEAGLKMSFSQALNKLLLFGDSSTLYCIIPLFPMNKSFNKESLDALMGHIEFSRGITEQKARIAIIGNQIAFDTSATASQDYIDTASYIKSPFIAYVSPSHATISFGTDTQDIGGEYIAAAVGALACNPQEDPAMPISGKTVAGFNSIVDPFIFSVKKSMAEAGVLIVDGTDNNRIIMDLTTDQSEIVISQIKFIKVADYVAKVLRTSLKELYINTKYLGATTLNMIATSTRSLLQTMVTNEIVLDYTIVSIAPDPADIRQINIVIGIRPVPDVTWIYIQLNVSL